MKLYQKIRVMRLILLLLTAVLLSACVQAAAPSTQPPVNETPRVLPTGSPPVVEVTVEIVTPEPPPTTAVCTPLPEDMYIHIRGEEGLLGVIEVEGLQPDDTPIIILTGEALSSSFREESTAGVVEADGRFQYTFDFRTWDSVEGYVFKGQLIHNRGVACFDIELPLVENTVVESREYVPENQPVLPVADYPPSKSPYYIEDGDLWLVHTPEGQLYAFVPIAPTYADEIDVDECRYTWSDAVGRFVDPCSGDEWELNGALNLEHSTELWSNRDLDQYGLSIQQGKIFVQLHNVAEGLPLDQPPLAQDSQYGVTVTAVTAEFTAKTTTIDTMIQVDPVWQMDPTAFPPQQVLSYPDVLLDDQGRTISGKGREGGTAVYDPSSGGIQQMMFNQWEVVEPDANSVTATLTVDLSNLYREVILLFDWDAHKPGDTWNVDLPLGIGYADIRVRHVEWLATAANGLARLRFTVSDDSPNDIRMNCLVMGTAVPSTPACAAFDNEQTYTILTQLGEPITLYLRAGVELVRPFQLRLDMTQYE